MAYRRSLTTKARLFAQQRFTPSISYVHRDEDRKFNQHSDEKSKSFLQNRSYSSTSLGFGGGVSFRDLRWSQFLHVPMLARNMSTAIGGGGEAEKIDFMADVVADNTMMEVVSTHAPAVSEVAVAAADSWMPIAAVQYAIDGVHNLTGLNWWGSIVITTLIVRTLTIPIMIYQHKATTKYLTSLIPQLVEIKQEMQDKGMSPSDVDESIRKMKRAVKQHGVLVITPFIDLLIQGPLFVCFFLAIHNMVDKVPSFKTGGTSWFLDLTTADPFYLLPCLTAFSLWIIVEVKFMQKNLEGYSTASKMKNVSRTIAALIVPLTANFPAALFCYWITSNLFSIGYRQLITNPSVNRMLNVTNPPFLNLSFLEAYEEHLAGKTNPTARNQRLEKEVKGRRKNQEKF